ncbi:hypothetical protein C2S51_021949 [Perilla frutescens var. frutescens]|nr:hypothetical protein C2S51_021949 [Perilla frutescens var. frutescens]
MSPKAYFSTKFQLFNKQYHFRASASERSTVQQSSTATATSAAAATAPDVKNKRVKCMLYTLLFIMFQIVATVTIFAVIAVKVRTPKFSVGEAKLTNYIVQPSALRATLNAEFTVKNTNFGPYKYGSTAVDFFYRGTKIGEVFVPSSKAGRRSTKKIWGSVDVDLAVSSNPQLSGDYSAGLVPITSSAKMSGRVEVMLVTKKSRSTDMNCSMYIVTATQTIWNIVCE